MRTVLVTGASSDIGLATCKRYLDAGWRVIAHYRTQRPELDALTAPALETWQADLADTERLQQTLREKASFFLRADALVNLAAELRPLRFGDATGADILATLSVNLVPGLLLMQAIGPAMAQRGFGRIVQVSSVGVQFGGGDESFAYSLSKHAQEFIPRSIRQWAEKNVLINVVRVGVTDTRIHRNLPSKSMTARTELIPMKRMAAPAEIANALFWFGSEQNGYATSQTVKVAGGE